LQTTSSTVMKTNANSKSNHLIIVFGVMLEATISI
jgi:hypothetical protein